MLGSAIITSKYSAIFSSESFSVCLSLSMRVGLITARVAVDFLSTEKYTNLDLKGILILKFLEFIFHFFIFN